MVWYLFVKEKWAKTHKDMCRLGMFPDLDMLLVNCNVGLCVVVCYT